MKCNTCLYRHAVISENGMHYNCSLPEKSAMKCLTGKEEVYVKYPIKERNEWIPITKGLPEKNKDVLLTICLNSSYYGFNRNFAKVKCGQYKPQHDQRDWMVDEVRYYIDNVIAWMPLPNPYITDYEKALYKEIERTHL